METLEWPSIWVPARDSTIGVLVLHGLTGSPMSVQPWASGFAEAGCAVSAPVLAGHWGHWSELERTTWHDWYETAQFELDRLASVAKHVYIAGFSMGGALALRLAQRNRGAVAGLTLVNPSVGDPRVRMRLVPLVARLRRTLYAPGTDVRKPGAPRHSHDHLPLRAVNSLRHLWSEVDADLGRVSVPTQIFYSPDDHVVPHEVALRLARRLGDVAETIELPNSYHVAMWDYDADAMIEQSVRFVLRQSERAAVHSTFSDTKL